MKKSYSQVKIFIDDERNCPEDFLLARTFEEAQYVLLKHSGFIKFATFDNDLNQGSGKDGMNLFPFMKEYKIFPPKINCHTGAWTEEMAEFAREFFPESTSITAVRTPPYGYSSKTGSMIFDAISEIMESGNIERKKDNLRKKWEKGTLNIAEVIDLDYDTILELDIQRSQGYDWISTFLIIAIGMRGINEYCKENRVAFTLFLDELVEMDFSKVEDLKGEVYFKFRNSYLAYISETHSKRLNKILSMRMAKK